MAKITFDVRFFMVPTELSLLNTHLKLIEDTIEQGRKSATDNLQTQVQKLNPADSHFDAERSFLFQEYDFMINCAYPRMLRGPFLISMFAIYESTVEEASRIIRNRRAGTIRLKDIKGGFLEQSKKYFEDVPQFELYTCDSRWQRLKHLSKLRNAVAHGNDRFYFMSKESKAAFLNLPGIAEDSEKFDCIIVTGDFLRETFEIVKEEIGDFMARFRQWDDANKDEG